MAKDNKGEAKKSFVKNAHDVHPEEEDVNRSEEPGTRPRTKTGAKPLPGAFSQTGKHDEEQESEEQAS